MLDNLLSGAIGSILGVIGAFYAARFAFTKTRGHEAGLARNEHEIRISGEMARELVAFYEDLRPLAFSEADDEQMVHLAPFVEAQRRFRRAVTVDAPLLGEPLEDRMKTLRESLRKIFSSGRDHVSLGEMKALTKLIHDTGDDLRDRRRAIWKEWSSATPSAGRHRGWTLTSRRNETNG